MGWIWADCSLSLWCVRDDDEYRGNVDVCVSSQHVGEDDHVVLGHPRQDHARVDDADRACVYGGVRLVRAYAHVRAVQSGAAKRRAPLARKPPRRQTKLIHPASSELPLRQ